ncbi:hypothetical protein [Peptoniphilus sp. HCN-40583]|uniref:hypothetical protein n=1 Tax=Peptoniphilus sp. HCN-40583 TaxID=3134662 RepID=UPI0030C14D35
MNNYFREDTIAFEKANPAEKQKMIDDATSEGDRKLCYSRECILAMVKWQQKQLVEAYDAFCYEQAAKAGNFEY